MGNCQAVDAASLVIYHPSGKHERMYWPITVSEVMKINPGHYVSLIIPLPISKGHKESSDDNNTVRFTRVKLLRPSDSLVLGRVYRLVTTQEVIKVIRARKHDQMKKKRQSELGQNMRMHCKRGVYGSETTPIKEEIDQAKKHDRHQQKSGSSKLTTGKPKSWRPSLKSISESGS